MDSSTKIAIFGISIWGGYILIKRAMYQDTEPNRRKDKQGLTSNHIDHQIDQRNRASGGKVPANLDVPFYSRHNYNRRRRSLHV